MIDEAENLRQDSYLKSPAPQTASVCEKAASFMVAPIWRLVCSKSKPTAIEAYVVDNKEGLIVDLMLELKGTAIESWLRFRTKNNKIQNEIKSKRTSTI